MFGKVSERRIARRELKAFFAANPAAAAKRKQVARRLPTAARVLGFAMTPVLVGSAIVTALAEVFIFNQPQVVSTALMGVSALSPMAGFAMGRRLDRDANTAAVAHAAREGVAIPGEQLARWARAGLIRIEPAR